ncbi:TonB-dependent receptor [Paraglaciecola sp.]|uniref:TonB-dependent receptor family protein n=1 Tax=Paraglaciecola sp. TaxID=1920173 RepID=UPI0030F395B3
MLPFPRTCLSICFYIGFNFPFLSVASEQQSAAVTGQPLERILVQGEQIKLEIETERALTPGGVTLIDGADLYQRNIASLADMLRFVPGVWAASSSGSDAMFFSSRGSNLDATNYDMNGIKLLQDGLPVTTADGNNHNRMIDPLSASFATVARGANALTYGASTLGGAIDFISPTARETEALEIFLNGGSHGQQQGRMSVGTVTDDFDALLTLEAKRWDGYRAHNNQKREGLYANAGWQLSDTLKTRLYFNFIDNNEELPGALSADQFELDPYQADPKAISGNYQVNVETWRLASKTTWEIDENSKFTVGLSYEEQTLYHPIVDKVMVDFDGPGPMPPTEVFSLLINTEQKNLGASLRYQQTIGVHDLLAGINYGDSNVAGGQYRNDGGKRNGLTTQVDNNAESLEVFLVDRWQLATQWKLIYGLQAVSAGRDVNSTDVASGNVRNPNADYHSLNPRVGLIFRLAQDNELFANISRLYEAPTNYELEDDVRASSETLDAMYGTVFEVGARGKHTGANTDYWHWDIAFYYARLSDEILSVDDPAAPGTSLSTNVDSTIHAGIEALIGASFAFGKQGAKQGDKQGAHRIEPLISLTVNDFSFADDSVYGNNQLPAAPGYVVKGELLYRNADGFYVGPTFDIVDERYADFTNTYTVDAYALLGLRMGLSRNGWEVYGEIRNLSDKKYIASHSVRDVATADAAVLSPGEPRSFYVGTKIQF